MKNIKRFRKPLVLLSLALVLALVWTTGASTYAKYITEKKIDSQSATVAKWGFIVSANADNLFGKNYYNHKTGTKPADFAIVKNEGGALCVSAKSDGSNETTKNVVAPGTKGEMTFKIGGSAEVLSKITVTAVGADNVYLTKKDTEGSTTQTYSPITWTLKSNKGSDALLKSGTLEEVINYINNNLEIYDNGGKAIKTNGGEIEPNTTIVETTFTLSWEWTFENNSPTSIAKDNTQEDRVYYTGNEADTILGQFATSGTLPTAETGYGFSAGINITFDLTITIAQIQQPTPIQQPTQGTGN